MLNRIVLSSIEHPTLYNREVSAFFPLQVNAHKFLIPYYVMTRDVPKELSPERYRIRLGDRTGKERPSPYSIPTRKGFSHSSGSVDGSPLFLTLSATDSPRFLITQERPGCFRGSKQRLPSLPKPHTLLTSRRRVKHKRTSASRSRGAGPSDTSTANATHLWDPRNPGSNRRQAPPTADSRPPTVGRFPRCIAGFQGG